MNTIQANLVNSILTQLHNDAKHDLLRIGKGVVKSIFRPIQPSDFKHAYLPISKQQGHSLKEIVINNDCKHVVEFGTSFGISTIYLADAVRQTGGKVVTTELIKSKADKALQNLIDAGLNDYTEIKIGNAMDTLKDHAEPIDFLFLDGWKDLYLPLFQMLESKFHSKTLIYADNMDMRGTENYANYVLDKRKKYATKLMDDGKAFLTSVSN